MVNVTALEVLLVVNLRSCSRWRFPKKLTTEVQLFRKTWYEFSVLLP